MQITNSCIGSNITIYYKKNTSLHNDIKDDNILTDGIPIIKSSNLAYLNSVYPFSIGPKKITVKSHLPAVGYYDITIENDNINNISISDTFYPYCHSNFEGLVINKDFSIEKELLVKGNITAFSTSIPSDIRLKKDIYNITDGLTIINKLRPVQFKWNKNNEEYIGFIAQEVEHVIPNLVKEIEIDGVMIKVIKEDKLLPYLVDSIKNISNRLRKYESF
jgi:hypothetical protein